MATLNSIELGNIQSEEDTKDSNLFNFPMPLSDSDKAILMDIMGTSRTITINGIITGDTSTLTTFISNIEAIQNGEQEGVAYVGDLVTASKNVFIQSFRRTYKKGEPTILDYSLTLMEGAGTQ